MTKKGKGWTNKFYARGGGAQAPPSLPPSSRRFLRFYVSGRSHPSINHPRPTIKSWYSRRPGSSGPTDHPCSLPASPLSSPRPRDESVLEQEGAGGGGGGGGCAGRVPRGRRKDNGALGRVRHCDISGRGRSRGISPQGEGRGGCGEPRMKPFLR